MRLRVVWLGVLSFACLAAADSQAPLPAVRIAKPPTIDGVIDETEWKEVPFIEGLHDVNTGAAYADTGRFWLAYDKDFVYFAARLKESEPSAIHATEYRTNVALTGDDFVELDLDLSGSMSAVNRFQINPRGATNISIAGGRAAKREWLGAFQAKARITADGWEAEARIPWRSMAIPKGGRRNVRFNILRFVAKNRLAFTYVYVPLTQTGLTPTWTQVELPKPYVDRSIKLLPYFYAGYDPDTKKVANAGLDMKTALTDQINLVGSINPDFRNIEQQILSIDFSRFERLAGEVRPFFQEGRGYNNSQSFVTQRIGRFDAGFNTYGRLSDVTSFSVLGTEQFGKERDGQLTVTHDPSPNTSLRFTMTDQERRGLSNETYLARLSQNWGAYNLFARTVGSKDSELGFGTENDAFLSYSKTGLAVTGGWARTDKNFITRLGFFPETDYQGPNAEVDYSRSYKHGLLSDWFGSISGLTYNHIDNSFYRKESIALLSGTLRPGINILGQADLANFEGSKDSLYTAQVGFPQGNPYKNLTLRLDTGRQAGIAYHSFTVASSYRLTKKLQLTLRHQHVIYDPSSDQTIFSANYDLGSDRSISGRIVRQDRDTNAYIAYRRSGNEGIEYFLILGDPNAQRFRASLILKLVAPFSLGRNA